MIGEVITRKKKGEKNEFVLIIRKNTKKLLDYMYIFIENKPKYYNVFEKKVLNLKNTLEKFSKDFNFRK